MRYINEYLRYKDEPIIAWNISRGDKFLSLWFCNTDIAGHTFFATKEDCSRLGWKYYDDEEKPSAVTKETKEKIDLYEDF